jgi:hypothetical protein
LKGVGRLSSTGYIQVHAYTSKAQIPLENVAVAVTDPQGNLIAARLTNKSGLLDTPIAVTVPDISAGESPDTGIIPYANVNIFARRTDYEQIESENVQIFPQTTTVQNLELIPLAELPENWNKAEIFKTPAQNL